MVKIWWLEINVEPSKKIGYVEKLMEDGEWLKMNDEY